MRKDESMENEILDEKLNLESEPPVSESIPDGDSTDGGEAESYCGS